MAFLFIGVYCALPGFLHLHQLNVQHGDVADRAVRVGHPDPVVLPDAARVEIPVPEADSLRPVPPPTGLPIPGVGDLDGVLPARHLDPDQPRGLTKVTETR